MFICSHSGIIYLSVIVSVTLLMCFVVIARKVDYYLEGKIEEISCLAIQSQICKSSVGGIYHLPLEIRYATLDFM